MMIGDMVRVVKIPEGLKDDSELKTLSIFKLCLGRTFPVAAVENNFIELQVGEVVGENYYSHSIWIEPECLELLQYSN